MYGFMNWLRKRQHQPAPQTPSAPSWSLFQYTRDDGSFDYEQYKRIQIQANKRKIDSVWVQEGNIAFLANYIRRHIPSPEFGICHGTRRGLEQQWFRKYLGGEVIGTEISDTADAFPHTIRWDFHETRPDWLGAASFIYSNSLDHSYDPAKCLNAWASCLRPDGILIIEHSTDDVTARETDPFGAHLQVMPFLVLLWSEGAYSTREIIKAPCNAKVGEREHDTYFLIIQRN